MKKGIKNYLLILTALLSIALGLLGIILPLLPTTPFFILALACFSRSSPRLHQKLLTVPYIGESLRQWEKEKKIDKKRKMHIYLIVLVSFLISVILLREQLPFQLMLISLMFVLLFFIHRIDEK